MKKNKPGYKRRELYRCSNCQNCVRHHQKPRSCDRCRCGRMVRVKNPLG